MRSDSSGVSDNHTTLHLVLVDTTEEQTYVIASFTFVKDLTEHLDTSDDRLLVFTETKDLNFVTYLNDTSLDTTGSNGTTTCDREDVLDGHQECLILVAYGLLNPVVASIHQLHNLVFPLLNTIQGTKSRAADEWSILLELILSEKFLHFHLNEFEHFLVLDHVTLVQEHNQTGNVHLTSEQDELR